MTSITTGKIRIFRFDGSVILELRNQWFTHAEIKSAIAKQDIEIKKQIFNLINCKDDPDLYKMLKRGNLFIIAPKNMDYYNVS